MTPMSFTYSYRSKQTGSQVENMALLVGSFNALVGTNNYRWYPILGKVGVGKENSNGYSLLQFCMYNNLAIQ